MTCTYIFNLTSYFFLNFSRSPPKKREKSEENTATVKQEEPSPNKTKTPQKKTPKGKTPKSTDKSKKTTTKSALKASTKTPIKSPVEVKKEIKSVATKTENEADEIAETSSKDVKEEKPKPVAINPFFTSKKAEKSSGNKEDGASYNPGKANYHPINDCFWNHGEK